MTDNEHEKVETTTDSEKHSTATAKNEHAETTTTNIENLESTTAESDLEATTKKNEDVDTTTTKNVNVVTIGNPLILSVFDMLMRLLIVLCRIIIVIIHYRNDSIKAIAVDFVFFYLCFSGSPTLAHMVFHDYVLVNILFFTSEI